MKCATWAVNMSGGRPKCAVFSAAQAAPGRPKTWQWERLTAHMEHVGRASDRHHRIPVTPCDAEPWGLSDAVMAGHQ